MLLFRYLMTLSGAAATALACGALAAAQPPEAAQPPSLPERELDWLEIQPGAGEGRAGRTPQPLAQASPVEPSPPESPAGARGETAPEDLNPAGNPLLFPTQPEEVEIQKVQPITLKQAIELAIQNNKELQVARLGLDRERANLDAELATEFPTVGAEVNLTYESNLNAVRQNLGLEGANEDSQNFNDRLAEALPGGTANPLFPLLARGQRVAVNESLTEYNAILSLNYDLYTGGNREASIRRADRQVRNANLEVERLAQETRFQATDRYYQLQNADAQVAIAQAAVEDTTQTLRDAQLLEAAGLGTRFDVLRAEVDLARANQGLTRAIADQRNARRQLAETLGIGQRVELTAAEEIAEAGTWPLSLEESIVLAYKNRAEMEQQLLQKEISEQDRNIALSAIRPRVNLSARYLSNDNFNDTSPVVDGYIFGAGVRWDFNLGGQAFAQARRAEREMDIADTNFARQRNQVRLEVEQNYNDLIANQENIESTRRNVELAQEALRLARLRFQAGVGTQTDVINAQRDLTDARSQFLQAIIGYNRSLNALQRAVSNLPTNRLFQFQ